MISSAIISSAAAISMAFTPCPLTVERLGPTSFRAYGRGVGDVLQWCVDRGIDLVQVIGWSLPVEIHFAPEDDLLQAEFVLRWVGK